MIKYYLKSFLVSGLVILVISCISCSHGDNLPSINPASPSDSSSTANNNDNDSVLTIANWNVDWFGSAGEGQGPSDKDLQEANVLKVVRYLNPDIIGFAEVVDIARFRAVADSLGSNYDFQVAQYGSGSSSINSKDYADDQKLAFIYKKNEFANIRVGPFLSQSSTAYTDFASGRFPYMLNANVTKNGITKNITFFMLHAKADADETSYEHRTAASEEFKDSLDAEGYEKKYMMILGDFNDELQGTIAGHESVSPYQNFVEDNNYDCVTLPLGQGNAASMIDESSVIDQQIVSVPFSKMYLSGSVKIRTDVTTVIPNYTQGQTSDHYPISSQWIFGKTSIGN